MYVYVFVLGCPVGVSRRTGRASLRWPHILLLHEIDGNFAYVVGAGVLFPVELLYQFAFGSPRHSPTVTALYPSVVSVESMYSVRLYAV